MNVYFRERNGGMAPLRYVDADSSELGGYPVLARAVTGDESYPLVLVGDEVKTPGYLSLGWVIEELKGLGVDEVGS